MNEKYLEKINKIKLIYYQILNILEKYVVKEDYYGLFYIEKKKY